MVALILCFVRRVLGNLPSATRSILRRISWVLCDGAGVAIREVCLLLLPTSPTVYIPLSTGEQYRIIVEALADADLRE